MMSSFKMWLTPIKLILIVHILFQSPFFTSNFPSVSSCVCASSILYLQLGGFWNIMIKKFHHYLYCHHRKKEENKHHQRNKREPAWLAFHKVHIKHEDGWCTILHFLESNNTRKIMFLHALQVVNLVTQYPKVV